MIDGKAGDKQISKQEAIEILDRLRDKITESPYVRVAIRMGIEQLKANK